MKSFLTVLTMLVILIHGSAKADILWNWVNAGTGTEMGTVITTGDASSGSVAAGSYTILDFSLSASNYALPIGYFSSGDYAIGQQDIGFLWDGTTITQFWRSSGTYTNGFSFTATSPEVGAPDYLVMNVDYFSVEIYDDTVFLFEAQTPVFTPVIPPQPGIIWNWSNSAGGGTEEGTFITLGTLDGGAAAADSYEVLDFTVTSSGFGLPLGSVSGGQYAMGQPGIGFLWDGSSPTQFWRSDGGYTNGFTFSVVNPEAGAPDRIAMEMEYFVVDIYYSTVFISESSTVVIVPEGTTLPVSQMSLGGVKALFR